MLTTPSLSEILSSSDAVIQVAGSTASFTVYSSKPENLMIEVVRTWYKGSINIKDTDNQYEMKVSVESNSLPSAPVVL